MLLQAKIMISFLNLGLPKLTATESMKTWAEEEIKIAFYLNPKINIIFNHSIYTYIVILLKQTTSH